MLSEPPLTGPDGSLQLHATTVVLNDAAVVITGPAGAGKTAMAFALMARGAMLLADDITWLTSDGTTVVAHCPPTLAGRIEARGIGILNAPAAPSTPVRLVVDLGRTEDDRIPEPRTVRLLGHNIPLLHTPAIPHFADIIYHYMTFGRHQDTARQT